ncbi:MAG: AAA family ATPase [Burkholderiales bacterium]|nr:AAA family ATPase [Burkholderiales bacterium]
MGDERLKVKNFFTLTDIDIKLGKFNVFIGEQGSGKSLLIKLIYFFRSILRLPIVNYLVARNQINTYIYAHFDQLFNLDNIKQEFEITYYFNEEFNLVINNHSGLINLAYSNNLEQLYINSRDKLINQYNNIPKQIESDFLAMVNVSHELISNGLSAEKQQLFIPAGRTFLVSLQNNLFTLLDQNNINKKPLILDKLLLAFGDEYQRAISAFATSLDTIAEHTRSSLIQFQKIHQQEWFEDTSQKILKGKYIPDNFGGFIRQKHGTVRPWNASTGQQEFLPVYLTLHNILYRKISVPAGNLYIEEPEAHLYPSAQKDILELLVFTTNIIKSESLCITTHSPYILTVLDNLIMANEVKDKLPESYNKNLLVKFEDVHAYYINGNANSLMNSEYRIIDADKLDQVSDEISNEFSKMAELL